MVTISYLNATFSSDASSAYDMGDLVKAIQEWQYRAGDVATIAEDFPPEALRVAFAAYFGEANADAGMELLIDCYNLESSEVSTMA